VEDKKLLNKDLILREELALERTKMAQYRTFLAFLRTALYFPVAGISMHQALALTYGIYLQWIGIILGVLILMGGVIFYWVSRKRIQKHRTSIGGYVFDQHKPD
jgi:putative membrane protein